MLLLLLLVLLARPVGTHDKNICFGKAGWRPHKNKYVLARPLGKRMKTDVFWQGRLENLSKTYLFWQGRLERIIET